MTPIATMVLEMISRGVDPEVIALAVSTAEEVLISSARPQTSADVTAAARREKDRIRQQNRRNNPQTSAESADNPQIPYDASISKDLKKDSKRQNSGRVRGQRIDPNWSPSDSERVFAKAEGFNDFEIDREAQKFRDYWTACAGTKGVKLDWPATWRQWIRSGADRAGKRPPATSEAAAGPGFYAKSDSPQLDAWDAYMRRHRGKGLPRDRSGGWRVASEWPPDRVVDAEHNLFQPMNVDTSNATPEENAA